MESSWSGNLEIAELLLRHRANVNADPSYHGGGLPISIASERGHLSVVDALIRHKADVNGGPNGSWPAQGHGHFPARGCGPITRLKDPSWSGERLVLFGSRDSHVPLVIAAKHGRRAVVELLLARGALVNLRDHTDECGLSAAGLVKLHHTQRHRFSPTTGSFRIKKPVTRFFNNKLCRSDPLERRGALVTRSRAKDSYSTWPHAAPRIGHPTSPFPPHLVGEF